MERSKVVIALIAGVGVATIGLSVLALNRSRRKRRYHLVGKVTKLLLYPVKSCRPIELTSVETSKLGLKHNGVLDRQWMVITQENKPVHQRMKPEMALIQPSITESKLCLNAPGMSTLEVDIHIPTMTENEVTCILWGGKIRGIDCGKTANEWLENYLNKPAVRLVTYSTQFKPRFLHEQPNSSGGFMKEYGLPPDAATYQNLCTFLLLSEQSVDDLNTKLSTDSRVTFRNFRPNILVSADQGAYNEDKWNEIRISDATFRNVKLCGRCTLTTINPEFGTKHPDSEPLRTLRKYRKQKDLDDSPVFGIYLAPDLCSRINVGDEVYARLK